MASPPKRRGRKPKIATEMMTPTPSIAEGSDLPDDFAVHDNED